MAEITSPRIESISDPNSEPREQPAQNPRAKGAAAGKIAPLRVPEVSILEDDDKRNLDEMA